MLFLMYNFNSYYKSCVQLTKISPGVVISAANNFAKFGHWNKLATCCSIAPVCKNYAHAQHFFLKNAYVVVLWNHVHVVTNCQSQKDEGRLCYTLLLGKPMNLTFKVTCYLRYDALLSI